MGILLTALNSGFSVYCLPMLVSCVFCIMFMTFHLNVLRLMVEKKKLLIFDCCYCLSAPARIFENFLFSELSENLKDKLHKIGGRGSRFNCSDNNVDVFNGLNPINIINIVNIINTIGIIDIINVKSVKVFNKEFNAFNLFNIFNAFNVLNLLLVVWLDRLLCQNFFFKLYHSLFLLEFIIIFIIYSYLFLYISVFCFGLYFFGGFYGK